MRDSKPRILTLAVIIVGIALLAGSGWAQSGASPLWPTYHADSLRAGQNPNSVDIRNPASMNLIWVFPRGGGANIDEQLTIVDDLDADFFEVTPGPTWRRNLAADDSWEDHFHYTPAASFQNVDQNGNRTDRQVKAKWFFPTGRLPNGHYQIMVWVPSSYTTNNNNTSRAQYTVYDDSGATTITFDQREGGYWKLLTTRHFSFNDSGVTMEPYRVELTNYTEDTKAEVESRNLIVVADAIKFVPSTGQEIYTSPASGILKNRSLDWEFEGASGTWRGDVPVVYTGTVESALANSSDAPDTGAVYCINSITPTTSRQWEDPNASAGQSWYKEMNGLAKLLGTTVWRYPRAAAERTNELEGPIEGGIYASPTLAPINDANHPLICYVAAMDRQVYALDAQTGELIWSGPGLTQTEGNLMAGGWTAAAPREAFGGKFHWVNCATEASPQPDRKTVVWDFPTDKRQLAGEPALDGWSYAVYAWVPARLGGDKARISDATYTITYQKYSSGGAITDTVEVKVDQSLAANQGRWVKLGSSYFNVSAVSLSNLTKTPGIDTSQFCVVADAVRIIPETIEAFGYSTPVVDVEAPGGVFGGDVVNNIFVGNSAGRMLAFTALPAESPIGRVKWIYPKVRSTLVVTGQADMDAPSMGEIAASPVYANGRLYIAGFNGQIRCLGDVQEAPTLLWTWPSSGETDELAHFTSSPAYDKSYNQIVIGDTSGVFYSINAASGTTNWKYPADPSGAGQFPLLPLGGFRYSTPAVASDSDGMRRAWVGSSDGRIYTFDITEPTNLGRERRMYVDYNDDGSIRRQYGTKWYVEPSVLSPIQGSIALDGTGTSKRLTMYVGDMREKGVLYWYSADNGTSSWRYDPDKPDDITSGKSYKGWRTEGQLFSSPNVTYLDLAFSGGAVVQTSYIYIGCGDGRIYAFSPHGGAWGGRWAGGEWPFEGQANDNSQKEEQLAPDAEIQFDIFPDTFWQASNSGPTDVKDMNYGVTPAKEVHRMPNPWPLDYIVSKEMKQPTNLPVSATDQQIDDHLRELARERRNHVFGKTTRIRESSDPNSAVYLEWGEKVNIILWNLPKLDFLYGSSEQSKRSSIRFNFANTSAGSSAGSQNRLAGIVRVLKEYTVLDNTVQTGREKGSDDDPTNGTPFTYYDALKYTGYDKPGDVKRSFALAQIEINGTGSRPPSPGPGWVLTAEIRTRKVDSANAPVTQMTIPLAKLTMSGSTSGGAPVPVLLPADPTDPTIKNYREQLLGINNPIAIRDDGDIWSGPTTRIAWPTTNVYSTNRNDPEAHFNGNGRLVEPSAAGEQFGFDASKMPLISLDMVQGATPIGVAHGTSSREGWLGVMDRSAVGLSFSGTRQRALDRFRINAGDLRWRGGDAAAETTVNGVTLGAIFPWELGIGSADYPNIYKRYHTYRKQSDDLDPSRQATALPPVAVGGSLLYDEAKMRPDTVYVSVEVPRFQPANMTGYTRTMEAFIDSDGDQQWDSGDRVLGRPTTYQEAYRRFRTALRVPPDPRIEVEEQLVDIGQAAHGMGEGYDFVSVEPHPEVRQWFKKITVKNSGNVNLYNIQVAKDVPLFMMRDPGTMLFQPGATPLLPGTEIRSSVDRDMPATNFLQALKGEPFTSTDPSASGDPSRYGYTLTKPKVGDPDPTVFSIPDRRKWDANYRYAGGMGGNLYTQPAARAALQNALAASGMPPAMVDARVAEMLPYPMEVSVRVPISQPIGTYQAPFVPVYSDVNGNGQMDFTMVNGQNVPAEPFAAPTFQLKVSVQENRLTGGRSPATLPQIDDTGAAKVGDATPAAFRDAAGNVHLFWSTNRMFDPTFYADPAAPDLANAPWLINRASLVWNNGWQIQNVTDSLRRWWAVPGASNSPYLPDFGATLQWPTLLGGLEPGASVMPWEFGGSNTGFLSVRHFSPVIAENLDVSPTAGSGRAWLAWAGVANIVNPSGKISQEYRLFYTDATGGNVTGGAGGPLIHSIEKDPSADKRYPSMSVYKWPQGSDSNRMWMFWQGGDNGRWSIYYSANDNSPTHLSSSWKDESRLRTPDCLASVASPNAVHRILWANLLGGTANMSGAKHFFDVVYSGISKLAQTPDILLSRYAAVTAGDPNSSGAQPGQRAQPMPRVFGEKLQRDSKYGFFVSEHLAWMRPSRQVFERLRFFAPDDAARILTDQAGRLAHMQFEGWFDGILAPLAPADRAGLTDFYNMPYVWVRLPANYGGLGVAEGEIVSATNGITPVVDDATGVYTYSYPAGSLAEQVFGQTLVDFSAGIVRFTKPLKEVKNTDGTVSAPMVMADYTPLTWRLTTDPAVDSSPRAFIERTEMTPATNPGMVNWTSGTPPFVDRLWVLWRKAGSGVDSSTIYWKTYRVGIDLSRLTDTAGNPAKPVRWSRAPDGTPRVDSGDITVSNHLGPWEVDRTGTKIYFSQVDERYRSLVKSGSTSFLENPAPPGAVKDGTNWKPITIEYTNADGSAQTVLAHDVFWQNETPEESLFGYVADGSVNEGSVYAFSDPDPRYWVPSGSPNGTWMPFPSSKIWVFWTSTRGGTSDLCWATLSPNFTAR